jgi:nucleotidyltransferase substrate binding protein (TIGR01987 family)
MEIVTLKYLAMQQALATLDEVLKHSNILVESKIDFKIIQDSMIKRFEYCIDSFWKFLKIYIEEEKQIAVKIPSPREVLTLSLQNNLITEAECQILINAVSDRNLTAHTYNQVLANQISNQIPLYFNVMKAIIDRLQQVSGDFNE